MTWYESPSLWVAFGGMALQAVLTWARVQVLQKNHEDLDAKHDREVAELRTEVGSLREWRAQAKEQFKNLERRMGPREDGEGT